MKWHTKPVPLVPKLQQTRFEQDRQNNTRFQLFLFLKKRMGSFNISFRLSIYISPPIGLILDGDQMSARYKKIVSTDTRQEYMGTLHESGNKNKWQASFMLIVYGYKCL